MLERKKLLPNEDWLVERYRLRVLGHTEAEIQESLVKGKVSSIVNMDIVKPEGMEDE